ncbi:putative ABC transport system ATP-binding protein [Lachnospiraceae bacterium NE2001]|nr:putative ABC transport system ATP-binding protein [Lachnospiraceae bacterium NE2001]
MSVLELDKISYTYDKKTYVLKDFSCKFEAGKVYAIVGKSGAGKTTLLSLLAGLDKLSDGKILFEGKDITKVDKYTYRSNDVGVVFQSYNLLPKFTARENVELSIDLSKKKVKNKKQLALELLKKVGLSEEEANRRVLKISGGQQQRVAIARAIAYEPKVVLADEPTGNLDPENQDAIMEIFKSLAHNDNKCVIIVTHSQDVAAQADEVYELKPNKSKNSKSKKKKQVEEEDDDE